MIWYGMMWYDMIWYMILMVYDIIYDMILYMILYMIWYYTWYDIWYVMYMIWYICKLQLGWHPVAVVRYTFTHKQYIEQHNETEYTERT